MKIAVLDDTKEDIDILTVYLRKFEEEKTLPMEIETYTSSFDFLEDQIRWLTGY